MTRMDWEKLNRNRRAKGPIVEVPDAAGKWLYLFDIPTNESANPRRKAAAPQTKGNRSGGVAIIVGEDAPGNTLGTRIVHHFKTVREARAAGFPWAI